MPRRTVSTDDTAPAGTAGVARAPRRRASPAPRRWWRYGFAVVGAALLVNAVAGERGYLEYRQMEARHAEAEAQLAAARAQNEALRQRNRQLKSDPVAIEREVRDQLGYAREGEVVFTIRDAGAEPRTPKRSP